MVYNNCEDTLRSGRVSTANQGRGPPVDVAPCKRRVRRVVISLWEGVGAKPISVPALPSVGLKCRRFSDVGIPWRWDSAALESCHGVERHVDRPRAGGEVD